MTTHSLLQKAQSRVSRMLHSVVLRFSPCEWRNLDDLPPEGDEYDEYEIRCVVVWQDAEHESDQGVEVTCLAHIRDGDFHRERYLNPVWRTVMDAPVFTQNTPVDQREASAPTGGSEEETQ